MAIPSTISEFLHSHEVDFTVVPHRMTVTSLETAEAAHVPGDSLAKALVLEDGERYVLAVIPATHRLDAIALEGLLDCELRMVGEQDFAVLFRDCRRGAVPAIGHAYGVATVVDVALAARPDVYIEAGDHENLIHVNRRGFERLMAGSERGAISYHV